MIKYKMERIVHNLSTGERFSTVRAAIDAATDGHIITVNAGTYISTVL